MGYNDTAIYHAAANPDTKLLHDSIAETEYNLNTPSMTESAEWIETPLLRAIKHNIIENVRLLLDAGADPNGVAIGDTVDYAIQRSRRFSLEDELSQQLVEDVSESTKLAWLQDSAEQTAITGRELSERKDCDGTWPFWCGRRSPYAQMSVDEEVPGSRHREQGNTPVTSLTVAAGHGLIQIFDLLLSKGADASFWLNDGCSSGSSASSPTCSALSAITPLHAAIYAGQTEIIKHLLSLGFSPNVIPLVTPACATSPLQYSIIWKSVHPSPFDILSADPRADFSRRTTYCRVSSLHLAVATLDSQLVRQIAMQTTLASAGVSALKHSLLHFACLPAADSDIKSYLVDPRVQECVHECVAFPNEPVEHLEPRDAVQRRHLLQTEMVMLLLEQIDEGIEQLVSKDIYGNTPLHYLAAAQDQNEALLQWLRGYDIVAEAWDQAANEKGCTPKDLYQERS